ncbi:MAG: TIGR01777 family protein [Armatimonadetes bacterium]|nr:MAG: TIGR01777 family protein [Armatimonadota bacterium]
MRVVLPGGSGQVGAILARWFRRKGDDVVVLSRDPKSAEWRTVQWDAQSLGPWVAEIDGADVVINLAGRSVNCRYTPDNRESIKQSRVQSTRVIGKAIATARKPPGVWLQSSTATIYAHRYDAPNDEATGILGGAEVDAPDTWRFSIDVARSWEEAADETELPMTRVVKLRSAMTMSPDPGGVFDTLLALVRRGLGGKSGDGRQYVSWIHEFDFLRAVDWIIEHEQLSGAVNLGAPNPLPNADFMRGLRRAWGTRIGLPASRWMLEIGAIFLKTETELILKSRRVVPGKLLQEGFRFEYPKWQEAAEELCKRWREGRVGNAA